MPGENNLEKIKFRRNRNVVTFSINMLIWTIEVVCALLVGGKHLKKHLFKHLNHLLVASKPPSQTSGQIPRWVLKYDDTIPGLHIY